MTTILYKKNNYFRYLKLLIPLVVDQNVFDIHNKLYYLFII